jgi:hypothetical protein
MNKASGFLLGLLIAALSCMCSNAVSNQIDQMDDPISQDYILGIFGNANMDRTVNQSDITSIKAMIGGSQKPTDLADANFDGKVDQRGQCRFDADSQEDRRGRRRGSCCG